MSSIKGAVVVGDANVQGVTGEQRSAVLEPRPGSGKEGTGERQIRGRKEL